MHKKGHCLNDPESWSEPAWLPNPYELRGKGTGYPKRCPNGKLNPEMFSWKAVDAPEIEFPDGNISHHAIKALRRFAAPGGVLARGQNFFLGVGFLKPHLPQVFPKKYLDLYANASFPHVASNPYPPEGAPSMAYMEMTQEISEYSNIHTPSHAPYSLPVDVQQKQKLGYRAASTFVDAQIGKVLGVLDELGLSDSTVVAVIGDHGWKLGEHGGWAKKTNYYNDVRGLLMVHAPGQKAPGRLVEHTLVEYIDLYPTLLDLALGDKKKSEASKKSLDGQSFAALLDEADVAHKSEGFHQYTCADYSSPCMGYGILSQMRGDTAALYHLIEWVGFPDGVANFTNLIASELYDLRLDEKENRNVVDDDAYTEIRGVLTKKLREQVEGPVTMEVLSI